MSERECGEGEKEKERKEVEGMFAFFYSQMLLLSLNACAISDRIQFQISKKKKSPAKGFCMFARAISIGYKYNIYVAMICRLVIFLTLSLTFGSLWLLVLGIRVIFHCHLL